MPDLMNPFYASILAVVVICAGAFLWQMHKTGRTAAQEVAAIESNPTVAAAKVTAQADAAALASKVETGFASLHAKFDAAIAAAKAVPPPAVPAAPIVGQSFCDIYDAVMAVAAQPNSIIVDGNQVHSGSSPAITFKTVAPVAPATTSSVVRES